MPATPFSTLWTIVSIFKWSHLTWRALSVRPFCEGKAQGVAAWAAGLAGRLAGDGGCGGGGGGPDVYTAGLFGGASRVVGDGGVDVDTTTFFGFE